MRHYETIFLLKPTLTEEETKSRIEFFRNLVTQNEGEIAGFDDIGIRQLAYVVEHNKRGYYYVIYFTSSNYKIIEALQKVYKITEDVLKFMTIRFDKQTQIKAWSNMVNKVALPELVQPDYRKENKDNNRNKDNRNTRGRDTREPTRNTEEAKKEPIKNES